jgi:FKBP-type peptidyl-prolyl cis-trans isomerase
MKLIFFCLMLSVYSSLLAQSKKDLQAQVTSLKSQIEEMKKPKEILLDSDPKKASYGIGILIASNLKTQGGDSLDLTMLNAGMTDVFLNKPLKIEKQECSMLVQTYMQKAVEKKTVLLKAEGTAFLAQNKLKEDVHTTASGLQYKIITPGTGKAPTASGNVTVHYTGKTIDGNIFDSSQQRGPATFDVSGVIAGWTEALQLMHEGDKWMLYIPYELAYGERGQGGQIAPYSTLIFEVELIKVN